VKNFDLMGNNLLEYLLFSVDFISFMPFEIYLPQMGKNSAQILTKYVQNIKTKKTERKDRKLNMCTAH